jgi:unsaturated rhamnogalacturonyl hydrolase
VKGTSPEFWGRAVGWYMMALVECLDYLPADHSERSDIEAILNELSESVLKYQDKNSLLWYQVLDKGSNEGNWIETSCSAMFAYAFAKGNRLGVLDDPYRDVAGKVVNALFDQYVYEDSSGNIHLSQTVKVGTLNIKNSKGDYDYYISTERRLDDYKGIAALLFACIELKK